MSEIIRDFKKHTSREFIKAIQNEPESRKDWLIRAFKKSGENLKRITNYKVWKDGFHPIELETNELLDEKIDYIHNNPVEELVVEKSEDYLYSSAKDYCGCKGILKIVKLE